MDPNFLDHLRQESRVLHEKSLFKDERVFASQQCPRFNVLHLSPS